MRQALKTKTTAALLIAFFVAVSARTQEPTTNAYTVPPSVLSAAATNVPSALPSSYVPAAMPGPPLGGSSQLTVPSAPPVPAPGTSQFAAPSAGQGPALASPFQWGPLTLRPHVLESLSYGNGLQATPGEQSSSFVEEFDPGIYLQWGNHWSLDYTALLRAYSSSAFRNTFDNAVTLIGGTTYGDWSFGLSQSYASYSDPIIETGAQTDQQTFTTALSARYQMSSKTWLELGVNQSLVSVDQTIPGQQLNSYNTWSTMDWLNYQFAPNFGAAIGAGFGYDNVSDSPDMTWEQLQGRITWRVVQKLSFVLSGGGQDLQFLGSGAPNLISPIFSLSAQYALFNTTTISVGAFSAVTPSYFQDQVTENTSISAAIHQRLLGRLFLDLGGGYGVSTYHASTASPAPSIASDYNSTFFSATLSTPILKRGSAAVFYTANFNSSGSAAYNYNTTMVGVQLSYRY
jgi:hypothetical protein